MEIIFTEVALYESKNECARNDNVFSAISEVCDGMVSLSNKIQNNVYKFVFKRCLAPFGEITTGLQSFCPQSPITVGQEGLSGHLKYRDSFG